MADCHIPIGWDAVDGQCHPGSSAYEAEVRAGRSASRTPDPERKLWSRAIRKLCAKGCTLDWHAYYNMDSTPPARLERFRKKIEGAFGGW